MAMYYVLSEDPKQNLVLGTYENPTAVDLDYCRAQGWKLYTLEEAINNGARVRNALGHLVWLGVNLKLKMEGHALYLWWLGKWRPVAYYSRSGRPSERWTRAQLERVARVNIPLDPKTVILYNWTEEV